MSTENLIKMANQIGDFFRAYPDSEQAKQDIASHIKRFWSKAMRQELMAYVNQGHGSDLQPIVDAAIRENQTFLA